MKIEKETYREIQVLEVVWKIYDQPRSLVYFASGEPGSHEAGDYAFWSATGVDEFGSWQTIGRAINHLPAEDRFLRMNAEQAMDKDGESRITYRALWRRLTSSNVIIRAASVRDIVRWMETHESDAKFAEPFMTFGNDKPVVLPRGIV